MQLTIGCMVWELPGLTFLDHIRWVAHCNFESVDFHVNPRLGEKAVDPDAVDETVLAELDDALAPFREVGIHAAFDITLISADYRERRASMRRLERTVSIAAELDAGSVTVHRGAATEGMSRGQVQWRLTKALSEIDDMAYKYAMPIYLEIVRDHDLVSEIDSPLVGVCLDTGHVALAEDAPPLPHLIRQLGETCRHVHIHDCDGVHDHLPLGDGDLPWDDIFAALGDIGYRGVLTLEVNPGEHGAGAILRSRRFLQQFVS